MSKVTYIVKASNDVLNEKTAAILVQIVKKNYITSAEVREILAETLNASTVNSNIGVLLKKGFIEKSGDGLMATGEAMDVIQAAADLFASENAPEMLTKRKTRSKRGVTSEMTEMAELLKTTIESAEIEVKEVAENRSNLEVRLAKRTKSVRQIEIRHSGVIRLCCYKADPVLVKKLSENGFTYKVGGNNTFIDGQITAENIAFIVNCLN